MKRVAVIGFGFMGMVHSQNILKCEGLELAAIIEKNRDSVVQKTNNPEGNFSTGETDAEAMKKVPVYTSLKTCLKEQNLDAVHVCVHTDLHYQMVKEALNSGLHVLVEKPFVLDVKKGEELVGLAKEKKLILMVAHVVRFMSPYKKLVQLIQSEEFGKLSFLSLCRFSGLPVWGQWKEKQKNFGSSGGALFDLIIHDIDFAAFALGEPDRIESTTLRGKLSKHDYVNACWHYGDKNLVVKIEGGNIFHSHFPFKAGFTAVFERATASYSTVDGDYIYIDNDAERQSIAANDLGDGYFNETELFSQCLKRGEIPKEYSPDSALKTIALCYRHI